MNSCSSTLHKNSIWDGKMCKICTGNLDIQPLQCKEDVCTDATSSAPQATVDTIIMRCNVYGMSC